MSDSDQYLAAIVSGDAAAFATWTACAERRLRLCLRPLAARVDTEAVLQETLLRVWQVAPRFSSDGKPESLLRFAVRVAHNLALDEARRTRHDTLDEHRLEELETASELAARAPAVPDPLLRRAISGCRERLPSQPARAMEERLASAGAEPDELLAARLGMRLNTFLQNVGRARKLLTECLQKLGIDIHAELT